HPNFDWLLYLPWGSPSIGPIHYPELPVGSAPDPEWDRRKGVAFDIIRWRVRVLLAERMTASGHLRPSAAWSATGRRAPAAAAPHDFSPTGKFEAHGCGQIAAVSFAMVVGSHEQPQPEDALNDQDHQTDDHDLHRRGGSNGWITLPLDLREDVHRQA